MANLPESATYEAGIYQLETTDDVLAGAGAIANLQATLLANRTAYLKGQTDSINADATQQKKAMSGDLLLALSPATAGTSAAVLNAAAAGTVTKTVTINLQDALAVLHNWSTNTLVAATSAVVADVDVSAPTVSTAAPELSGGTVDVILTYDTDAGVTKTYAAGDTVTLTISSAVILGYSIADVSFVDTIIA